MKHLFTLLLPTIVFISCRKDVSLSRDHSSYLDGVKASLKDSLSAQDLTGLNFSKAVLTRVGDDSLRLLRIPFKGKSLINDFVLVQTDHWGQCIRGRIIHLRGSVAKNSKRSWYTFHGAVVISTLRREVLIDSDIQNGYINAFHRRQSSSELSLLAPAHPKEPDYKELPEVIVLSKTSLESGSAYSSYLLMGALFGSGGGGSSDQSGYSATSGYYGEISYDYRGGYSAGSGSKGSNTGDRQGLGDAVYEEDAMLVDFERVENFPAIEIEKYLQCFSTVPDQGASCSIEILTDIPVDKDPNKLFNWQTESPGHTFLQIKKSNGSKSVIKNIGFYPEANWKVTLTPAPVQGKLADNSEHEFNASMKMDLSPAQLETVLTGIRYLARFIKYDIDEYNCTNFALDVFNEVRVDKLRIPLYEIPGGMTPAGTSTPQGLYNQLKAMKQANGPEAVNINIPGVKGWVAKSSGQCN